MIEVHAEFPQREVIQANAVVDNEEKTVSEVIISAKPEITGVTASVDNETGIPYVDVTETGTGTDFSFDLAFHNLKGERGLQGETGPQGPQGLQGPQGEKGDTGATGPQGDAATIELGTVTTGEAGTDVIITNSGTSSEAVFNFTIPRGSQGIQGEQGPQGIQGIQGVPGQDGTDGTDGYSPTATVKQSDNVTTISITDKNGTTTESIDLSDYVLSSSLATVATSGSYNDLSNKPTIPTVNDGTITINQGGTQKGTFTLNQSGNTTIDLDAGGGGGSIDYINGGNA